MMRSRSRSAHASSLIAAVQASIAKLLPTMPRKDIIAASLANRGIIAKTRSLGEACDIANRIAPEHLEVLWPTPRLLPLLRHAARYSWAIGSSESIGDYVAGTNHVLPTHARRASRRRWVYDFQKRTSLIHLAARRGDTRSGSCDAAYGRLQAHARAAELRKAAFSPSPLVGGLKRGVVDRSPHFLLPDHTL